MRKITALLTAISLFLFSIYAAIMLQISGAYVFTVIAIAAPIGGIVALLCALLPQKKEKNGGERPGGKTDEKK